MALPIKRKLRRFPPIVCRLLARTGPRQERRPLRDEEIARASGLPVSKVRSLSWEVSWDDVPVGIMLKFSEACGVDFSSREILRMQTKFLSRKPVMRYLRKDREWETKWSPMMNAYRKHLEDHGQSKTATTKG
jgi:hypothetical protein